MFWLTGGVVVAVRHRPAGVRRARPGSAGWVPAGLAVFARVLAVLGSDQRRLGPRGRPAARYEAATEFDFFRLIAGDHHPLRRHPGSASGPSGSPGRPGHTEPRAPTTNPPQSAIRVAAADPPYTLRSNALTREQYARASSAASRDGGSRRRQSAELARRAAGESRPDGDRYRADEWTDRGVVAQLGEHLHGMQGVGGSSPPSSTTIGQVMVVPRG